MAIKITNLRTSIGGRTGLLKSTKNEEALFARELKEVIVDHYGKRGIGVSFSINVI